MRCHYCEGSIYWLAHMYLGKPYCSVTCLAKWKKHMENPHGEKETPPHGTLRNNVVDCQNENCGQKKSKKDKAPP